MTTAMRGTRLQIAILGRCNTGKSTILNRITGQSLAIVSTMAGTTSDPVNSNFELLPYGPVVMYDTAGVDEAGDAGSLRLSATRKVLMRADIALVVTDEGGIGTHEKLLISELQTLGTPVLVVFNKCDVSPVRQSDIDFCNSKSIFYVASTPADDTNPDPLRLAILAIMPQSEKELLVSDLLAPESVVVCVAPVDASAPKGRLIAPQVQALRELIEEGHQVLVTQEVDMHRVLPLLSGPPALVIVDSRVIKEVAATLPEGVPLTTFSMLFSRLKGDFSLQAKGAKSIVRLKENDAVLIAEACSHHAQSDDIGRVLLPKLLRAYVGSPLEFEFYAGNDFPSDLSRFKLVLHCGGCMLNAREMRRRLMVCTQHEVPVTNYGMAISFVQGHFERVVAPFFQLQPV